MDNFFTLILLMGMVFELPLLAWLLGKMGSAQALVLRQIPQTRDRGYPCACRIDHSDRRPVHALCRVHSGLCPVGVQREPRTQIRSRRRRRNCPPNRTRADTSADSLLTTPTSHENKTAFRTLTENTDRDGRRHHRRDISPDVACPCFRHIQLHIQRISRIHHPAADSRLCSPSHL